MSLILVAEDEPGIARFVTRGLTSAGHLVETVDNGDDALALAIGGSFDLLLLDLGLPGRDGFGVLTELRRREFYEKPTQERKRKKSAAVKRHLKRLSRENMRGTGQQPSSPAPAAAPRPSY